jgi:prophage antirepressor-like protein
MTGLTSRIFDGHMVRFIVRPDGVWFVGIDVCDILGIQRGRDSIAKTVSEKYRNTAAISGGNRGNPNTIIISEAGFYQLVFQSRKPEAQRFTDWVCEEVLPAIRRQGFYAANGIDPRLARVEQGRMLMEQARLMRREADIKMREAKALLTLEGAMSVRAFLDAHPQAADIDYTSALSKVYSYARRHNIPVGRDADGRATVPVDALAEALDLSQSKLTFDTEA